MDTFKTFKELIETGIVAQGDLLIVRADLLPGEPDPSWEEVISTTGSHIVAHSETGHHHVLRARGADSAPPALFRDKGGDVVRSLLKIPAGSPAEIVHRRESHTHGTILVPPGVWYLIRQQRPTPEGWEIVTD